VAPPIRITVVSSDAALSSHIQLRLQSKGYQVVVIGNVPDALCSIYSDPPDLLIFDLSAQFQACADNIAALRNDSLFSTIPVIGLLASIDSDAFDWQSCPLDDFTRLPLDFNLLFGRISLALSRIKRIFDNNPLTRLPGNTSIQRAIEDALGKPLAVCYVDINNFKPFNDVFGFAHGDEVIRMLARIMFNAVRDSGGGFCGHIGGDDFVCVVPLEQAEPVCKTIIKHFDQIVLDLFDEDTKGRGYYKGLNRRGVEERIPLLSISIGVVPTNSHKLQHFARVAEVAAELKALAKQSKVSLYVIDKRKA